MFTVDLLPIMMGIWLFFRICKDEFFPLMKYLMQYIERLNYKVCEQPPTTPEEIVWELPQRTLEEELESLERRGESVRIAKYRYERMKADYEKLLAEFNGSN